MWIKEAVANVATVFFAHPNPRFSANIQPSFSFASFNIKQTIINEM